MRLIGFVNVILCAALASGCHVSCCSKRVSEKKCPTDIRKTHCWCFGEDALFRYPCGPNRVFYGHKATCWREWPTSGSQWRDMHCGPPVSEVMPQDGQVLPLPGAELGPPGNEPPNPFRDEAQQASPPAAVQIPTPSERSAPESNEFPATPNRDSGIQPDGGAVPEAAPAQPMPELPMSDIDLQPMANRDSGPQLEFQSWPTFVEAGKAPAQRNQLTPEMNSLPAAVEKPMPTVIVDSSPTRAAASLPVAEIGSRWRLVVHDDPNVLPVNGHDVASRFRPPFSAVSQTPAASPQDTAPLKQSIEEATQNALKRFMSSDAQTDSKP
jgi:hypothetical protein